MNKRLAFFLLCVLYIGGFTVGYAETSKKKINVIAFFTAKHDQAHISFVAQANHWFSRMGDQYGFRYDTTSNWKNLNAEFLQGYQAVIFLDTRPEDSAQRAALKKYMDNGGGWLGFHFAAFSLTPSAYNQDWDWYHNIFLGCGEYKSNTWRPTSAVLRVEEKNHPATKNLPQTIQAAPNEWYAWQKDLKKNPDINVLLSIDPASYPLGTGPKQHEIWHAGYYPVVWTNKKYKMIYFNMGHNDIDYAGGTNKDLSSSFSSEEQNRLIIESLIWVANP
jgi:uncharacterized protein